MHDPTVSRPLAPLYKLFLFGRFRLERRDPQGHSHPLPPDTWDRQSPRRVLTYLLLAPGRHSLKDPLLDALCPDDDFERAQAVFSQALSLVRRVLVDEQGYPLLLPRKATPQKPLMLAGREQIWCDWDEFQETLMQAQAAEQQRKDALPLWEQAYALCREEFLLEERYSDWCREVRERAEGDQRLCLLHLAACYQQQKRSVDAERILRAWLSAHALDQDALCRLMEMLAEQERVQEALSWYRRVKIALDEEGMEIGAYAQQQAEALQMRQTGVRVQQEVLDVQEQQFNFSSDERRIWKLILPVSALPAQPVADLSRKERNLEGMRGEPFQSSLVPELVPSARFVDRGKTLDETLQEFATLTSVCRHLSEGNELQTAEQILWSYLPRLESFLPAVSLTESKMVAHLVAEGYLLAASLVGHRNDFYWRQRYSEQALFYGEIAQDVSLQVAALRQIAVTFNYQERFQRVLETYQRSLPLLADRNVSPLLRSCIYAALSGVYAQFQQEKEADHAIGLAYEHFAEHQGEEPDLLRSINASENLLIQWAGENHLKLGYPRQAEVAFAKLNVIDPELKLPKRIRIEAINARVPMFIAIAEMEQACSYLETALRLAIEVGSSLRLREVAQMLTMLRQQWPQEKPVHQLGDLLVEVLINHPK